ARSACPLRPGVAQCGQPKRRMDVPELGGELYPVSSRVVWAVCATGSLAGVWTSTDGGISFKPVTIRRLLPNSTKLAPASAEVAVVAAGPRLLRTTDGGTTWRPARTPPRAGSFFSIGFVDARV